jgi:AcrR family transcriptional regulator
MEDLSGQKSTLSRTDWLSGGLNLLVEEGPSAMKVARLANCLGVTRGSFYWHFKTVPIYQEAMFEFWLTNLIRAATSHAKATESPIEELLRSIGSRDLPKYDQAIRSWASSNPLAARAVERADAFRLARITELLNLQGLSLENAQMRAQAIIWVLKGTENESNIRWRNKVFLELFSIATHS